MIDMKSWLEARGIPVAWAESAARSVKKEYPILAEALKSHPDVRCELELIALVYDATHNNFVHTPPSPRDS